MRKSYLHIQYGESTQSPKYLNFENVQMENFNKLCA